MDKFIYKYVLDLKPTTSIKIPAGYEILTIQQQHNNICLWALVDTDSPVIVETFHIIGTGQMFPWEKTKVKYVNTVQMGNGALIWHIFKDIS